MLLIIVPNMLLNILQPKRLLEHLRPTVGYMYLDLGEGLEE
jgi:hypothetical protein